MQHIHVQEKEQLKKLFDQEDVDHLEERFKILEVFLQTEKHLSAAELVDLVRKDGTELDPEFVIDTLKLLCRYGFAQRKRDGIYRFRTVRPGPMQDGIREVFDALKKQIRSGFFRVPLPPLAGGAR